MSDAQPQVFISYQRSDGDFARLVREHLVAHGVQTWMDQFDIPVGAYWPDEIDKGLSRSDIVVGVLSPDAVESRNVKNEWDWTLQNGKRLLLLQYRPCVVPHRYVSINFIDATGPDPSPGLIALSRTLGVTHRLADAPAKADEPAPTRHAHRVPRPASRIPTFLAGREREKDTLGLQLERLKQGHGSLILIGGEAGIGKTTITSWLAGEAVARGAVVLTGGCYDLTTTPPYGPWGEIVRGWPEERGFPPVPDELRGGEAMARLHSQAALFELATDLLATAGTVKPVVVLLEDLHWADQASLDLLRHLARLVAGFRLMLVATYRDDELTRRHPLYQLLPSLAREPGSERLALTRLDVAATRELIDSRYGLAEAERERLVWHVQSATEGNPLFASEVLRALVEGGSLRRGDDGWELGDLERIKAPELVRQVIEARLERLGDEAQRLLGVASVIGHDVPLNLWIAVSGADESLLSDTLDLATEAHIVEELRRGDGFRFTHALIRETLYEGVGLLRRRSLHRAAGEALVAGARPDPDTVAYHFAQSSDPRAYDWLIKAGLRAEYSYTWLIAAERYEKAAAMIADDAERRRDHGWLLAGVGFVLRFGDTVRAIRYMDEAAQIGLSVGDAWLALFPRLQAGYYRVLRGEVRYGVTLMVTAGEEMEAAFRNGSFIGWEPPPFMEQDGFTFSYMQRAAFEHPDRAVVLPRSLVCIHLAITGRLREARMLTGELASVWPPDVEAVHQVEIGTDWRNCLGDLYYALTILEFLSGRPEAALNAAGFGDRFYRSISHHALVASLGARVLWTLIAFHTEDIGRRRTVMDEISEAFGRARGVFSADGIGVIWGAQHYYLTGEWERLLAMSRQEFENPPDGGGYFLHWAAGTLAGLCAVIGLPDEAWLAIERCLPEGPATEPEDIDLLSCFMLHDAAIALALDAGDVELARAWLESYDRWLEWSGAFVGQVERRLGWARYWREVGDMQAAEQQAHAALGIAREPRQPLGMLASQRLLGELATGRGDYEVASDHLRESLTIAEACVAPFEVALTRLAQAELAVSCGNHGEGRALVARVRASCEPLGAHPALARVARLEARLEQHVG